MHFSHISIGGGVTGIETVISAFNKIKPILSDENIGKEIKIHK